MMGSSGKDEQKTGSGRSGTSAGNASVRGASGRMYLNAPRANAQRTGTLPKTPYRT